MKRARDYSANIGLVAVVVIVMGGAMLIASQLGLGASIIIAGFTAIFFTLGIGGGSLRADLRKAAWYGPLTALSASVPRIIASQDHRHVLALGLVCLIILVAGLLPALGKIYEQAGLGLGIATLLGFALQADTGPALNTVAAAFVGVIFVVLLRVLIKLRDPSDVTRDLVGATLTEPDPAFEQAYTMWLRDKPVRWLGETLEAAVRYRTIRTVLSAEEAATVDRRAVEVAAVVAAKDPGQPGAESSGIETPGPAGSTSADTAATRFALQALDGIEEAARRRDDSTVRDAAATRRALAWASVQSTLTWRSLSLRHAIRTALGVLLTFLLAWATVGPHDGLVTSMVTASFAILQISWTDSLFKARERLLGVSGGALVMALVLWLAPPQWLLPIAIVAAIAGLWLIASNQVLAIGFFVIVSVGMNVVGSDLGPTRALAEYVFLLFSGLAIGLLIGFAVVPHVKPDPVDRRVRLAREAAAELLRSTARLLDHSDGARPQHGVPRAVLRPLRRLRTQDLNLRSPLGRKDRRAGVPTEECHSLATQFGTLALVGVLEASGGRLGSQALDEAAEAVAGHLHRDPSHDTEDTAMADFVRLAQWVGTNSAEFLNAHGRP